MGISPKVVRPIRQVIAIRGTATAAEWWDNLNFLPVSFDSTVKGGGDVADGFYDIYKTLTTMDPAQQGAPLPRGSTKPSANPTGQEEIFFEFRSFSKDIPAGSFFP
jgi:hypothetical protein